ncbi:uncharacterized protein LOC129715492 [Leucoraja erinacea]|uniref:uncharacterized protein LOC129715492 n=1 Tax=Leucoraja erinaceus TaxID=7782 RepID=UPI0024544B97|nr:uncharacterized protein LOC129715492 [Leucoraja erinacea]
MQRWGETVGDDGAESGRPAPSLPHPAREWLSCPIPSGAGDSPVLQPRHLCRILCKDLHCASPMLTEPQAAAAAPVGGEAVEGSGGTEEVGIHGRPSVPDCPNTAGSPTPPPASRSPVLPSGREVGEWDAGAGDGGGEAGGASLASDIRLKAEVIVGGGGSDQQAGDGDSGWFSPAVSLAEVGCPTSYASPEPPTGFAHHPGATSTAKHNPSLPEASPERSPTPAPLLCPPLGFPTLRNSIPLPAEAHPPQPTRSSSTPPGAMVGSQPSGTRDQTSPALSQQHVPSQDCATSRDPSPSQDHGPSQYPCGVGLPEQHLPRGFDHGMSFPLAKVEYVPESNGIMDQEIVSKLPSSSPCPDSTFNTTSPQCRHGQMESHPSQKEYHPCSDCDPPRQDTTVASRCGSEGTVEDLRRSAFPEQQGESKEAAVANAAVLPESLEHHWASSDQDIQSQLRECQLILQGISEALQAQGVAEEHVTEWREKVAELEKQTVPVVTHVAVVGDTGSGKSSLLNALLDEEGVLPTSAMRACTAVVVEISHNASSQHYTADVEFFSVEEWNKELASLLSDMNKRSGRRRRRRPDPGSEASVAQSRLKAVYGQIRPYQELQEMREVTQYLGTTTTISEEQASEFRSKVVRFIDSRNDSSGSKGGEFWPIVKRVRVQVPRSDVLQTGAVLVDLPGVRDSNAARNSVAKEYLKRCDAVWIVADVTRAVDDKTAKEMLDESLRRQLLMDGQVGSIAFICTKTDSHNVTEIMSALPLTAGCISLEADIAQLRKQIEQGQRDREDWTSELELAPSSNQNGERTKQVRLAIKQLEVELTEFHREVSAKQSELSLNAIEARNSFCKQKIRLNFKRGLQDLKCQARDEDTESDEELGESDEEDEDEDVLEEHFHTESLLPVFTVSSTEYLKLRDMLQRDGPPRVFHNIEDTEIPAVQRFVHRTTLARQALGTEVVVRDLASFISHIVTYLTNRRAQAASCQALLRGAVQDSLSHVQEIFQEVVEDCSLNVRASFTTIKTQLNVGRKAALKSSADTVNRWGSRPPSGFPYATYRATCSRNGTYASPACGTIDFNEDLSRPLLTQLQVVWNAEFSGSVPRCLQRFQVAVVEKLDNFFTELLQRLRRIKSDASAVEYILNHHLTSVRAKLENFTLGLLEDIADRQRNISRTLTPAVQDGMVPAYVECSGQSGAGSFDRMKACMEIHTYRHSQELFNTACRRLEDQLDLLTQEIQSRLKVFLDDICSELLVLFEPLLKPVKIIDEIIPKLATICRRMKAVCHRSQIDFTFPKIEEADKEPEPAAAALRKRVESGTPPLQEMGRFVAKVKIMQIKQMLVPLPHSVEISLEEVVLKYKESDNLQEKRIPFLLLSVCEFCTSLSFLTLTHRKNHTGREQVDVVVLEGEQACSLLGHWMEALANRWRGQLEIRPLELEQGVQRLSSLGVIYQSSDTTVPMEEETPCAWARPCEDPSPSPSPSSSSCASAVTPSRSRKREWGEREQPRAVSWAHRRQSSQLSVDAPVQPPALKKEKGDWQDSIPSQEWLCRSMPPVLKKESYQHPVEEDFDKP